MSIPLTISFRNMSSSESFDAYVRARAVKLEHFATRITACHVSVGVPHRHQHTARPVRVAIELLLPGGKVLVGRARDGDPAEEDAHAAVDKAFDQAARQLKDYVQRQRSEVKTHEQTYRDAHVAKLWSHEGYGFLATPAGEEIYFHKNSVLNAGFGRMKVGSHVRFIEEPGDRGPQASTIVMVH